jgi:parallel beta helix pectate lyase-like protein
VLVANASAGFLNNATIDSASQGLGVSGGALGVNGGTIENSRVGVYANAGGSLQLDGGVLITGSSFMGVSADHGGSVNLQNATVQNSGNTGVMAFSGGSAFIGSNGLVQNNRFGGVDANAGTADVEGHVTGNGCGVCAENGGRLTIQNGALVDGNGTGVQLGVGASFAMQQATIRNNTNDGVHLQGTASGMFNDNNTITGNGGWGIFCDGPPAVAQIQAPQGVGNVSGNSAGQIDCPTT